MWLTGNYNFSWNVWRETASIFFIPTGFLLAKIIERESFWWAMSCCALFVIGCFGSAAMMPLFRLGAFYPIETHNAFPAIVTSVLGNKSFAETLYLPGLCLSVSLVIFGVGFLKYKSLKTATSIAFIMSGIFFWLGNAAEMDIVLVIGNISLLITFCYVGYLTSSELTSAPVATTLVRNVKPISFEQADI